MWQRIQTLYLAIATGFVIAMFFCTKAVSFGPAGEELEYGFTSYVPYLILLIIIALLEFLALTTYKHRIFQMRTAILAAIITLALQAWIAVDYFSADENLVFRVPAIFPLAAVILDCLAARGIYADELMVESFSSLRKRKR